MCWFFEICEIVFVLHFSLLFGNLFVYFEFRGEVIVQPDMRTTVFMVLGVTCLLGVLALLPLRKPPPSTDSLNLQGYGKLDSNFLSPINYHIFMFILFIA